MEFLNPQTFADLYPLFPRIAAGSVAVLGNPMNEGLEPPGSSGWLGIWSSGSTGMPKLVWRRWDDLVKETVAHDFLRSWIWATPFAPTSFAGVQVALQAWVSSGSVIQLNTNWTDAWRCLRENRVQALSCTPTYADLLLQHDASTETVDRWQPLQITLGGEMMRPGIGHRLQARFPQCHFTVVYASAEFGVLLKTHRLDGWYELAELQRRYPRWRVAQGELEVQFQGAWKATGDLVELKEALLRVAGRVDDVANVAGTKVNLSEVSSLAEKVPGVRRAVAFAQSSGITGQVVGLKIELDLGANQREVTGSLEAFLRASLRKEAWPRALEFGEVGLGANSKRESGRPR
jgi:long-chain acyl-CoA synthetase